MRIVLVGHLAGVGGTERHLTSLIGGLPGLGFEVELITSERGPLTERATRAGVASTVVARGSRFRYVWDLYRRFRRVRPDLVHAHSGRLPCLAARLAGVPRVVDTRHGHLDPRLPRTPRPASHGRTWNWRWRMEGWKCRIADHTLTVCRADADELVRRGGLDPARVRAVHNGLADALLDTDPGAAGVRPDREPLLLWVGRMTRQKAPERVLELFAALVAEDSITPTGERGSAGSLRLVLVGDGPLRAELEARASATAGASRVCFAGASDDPLPWMRRARLLLLPSREEGLPYVLLESLAAGLPILATPVGGVEEVLAGDLAPNVIPWNLRGWTERARRLLRDEDLWQRQARASRERAGCFRESRMLAEIAEIYRTRPTRPAGRERQGGRRAGDW